MLARLKLRDRLQVRGGALHPGDHLAPTDIDRRTRGLMNQLRALHPDSDITITPAA